MQMLAAGFALVLLDFRINGLDLLPDVVGGVLCALALGPLTSLSSWFRLALIGAVVAAGVSLEEYLNPPSGLLVQTASLVALTAIVFGTCTGIRAVSSDPRTRRAANIIRWVDLATSGVIAAASVAALILLDGPDDRVEIDPVFLVLFIPGLVVMIWFVVLAWRTPMPPTTPPGSLA